uniref:Integrase core domain containing protein n=1 Tax=Solanum tuberosum TaxID=4113 RepID=M1DDE5_SOLTU
MEQMMDRKVQALHQCFDVFELRVLEQPALSTNVSAFRKKFDTLFGDDMPPTSSSHHVGKYPHSSRSSEDTEAERDCKRERQKFQEVRRATIVYEEICQQRAREVGVGASSSVSTTDGAVRVVDNNTDGAVTVDAGTTEGDLSVDLAGSGNRTHPLVDRHDKNRFDLMT